MDTTLIKTVRRLNGLRRKNERRRKEKFHLTLNADGNRVWIRRARINSDRGSEDLYDNEASSTMTNEKFVKNLVSRSR